MGGEGRLRLVWEVDDPFFSKQGTVMSSTGWGKEEGGPPGTVEVEAVALT